MGKLGEPNRNEADAVDVRQELDLKVGCAFTRFQTQFFHGKYGDLESSLISYGPCQTPTLQFCVQRHDERTSFQPATYHTIDLQLRKGEQTITPQWSRGRIFSLPVANTFLQLLKDQKTAKVLDVTRRNSSRTKPLPLNTVALLMAASRHLYMSPNHALQVAERLYLGGWITYPRTETRSYPSSFDVAKHLKEQSSHSVWGHYARRLLAEGLVKGRRGEDAGDHPPIVPVRVSEEGSLSGEEWRVYELVVRHFLASVSEDCLLSVSKTTFDLKGEKFTFQSTETVKPGFTEILQRGEDDEEGTETKLSGPVLTLNQNDILNVSSITLKQGLTTAPPNLTEADLLGLMEKHGIGTDASMATHMNNIVERNYVSLEADRRMKPTKLGISLIHGFSLVDPELVLPTVRSAVESLISLVSIGKARKDEALHYGLKIFNMKFNFFVENIGRMDQLFEANFTSLAKSGCPFSKCGLCLRYMKLIESAPTRLFCPCCDVFYNLPSGGTIKLYKEIKCPLDGFELVLFTVRGGKHVPICPACYNDPPFENAKEKMSCNNCLHPSCKHALIRQGICRCVQESCDGILCLDVLSAPKWKLDCNECNFQLKLTENVHAIKVMSGNKCDDCGATLIRVTSKKNVSNSKIDNDQGTLGCIVCTPELHNIMESSFSRMYERKRGSRSRRGGRKPRGSNKDPKMTFDRF